MPFTGAHVVLYSKDPEEDRRFFRDTLKFSHVDAGDGWLIFALPPAEVAIHPAKSGREGVAHSLFLMCDDLGTTVASLRRKKVKCRVIGEQPWGKVAMVTLPSGADLGLYEPKHPVAHAARASGRRTSWGGTPSQSKHSGTPRRISLRKEPTVPTRSHAQ